MSYVFFFIPLRSIKPCSLFSSQLTEGRRKARFNLIFLISAAWVLFFINTPVTQFRTAPFQVAIKVPTFNKQAADAWFVHLLDAKFAIKSSTKFSVCSDPLQKVDVLTANPSQRFISRPDIQGEARKKQITSSLNDQINSNRQNSYMQYKKNCDFLVDQTCRMRQGKRK